MTDTPTTTTKAEVTATQAQLAAVNSAARTFHGDESKLTADAMAKLIASGAAFATALDVVRDALQAKLGAKAAPITPTRLHEILVNRGDTEASRSDVAFAMAFPTDENGKRSKGIAATWLTWYSNKCANAERVTLPTWPGFKAFVTENGQYRAAHGGTDKFTADGAVIDTVTAKQATDKVKRDEAAATMIRADHAQAVDDLYPADIVAQVTELRIRLHDVTRALNLLTEGMGSDDRAESVKRYKAAIVKAQAKAEALADLADADAAV